MTKRKAIEAQIAALRSEVEAETEEMHIAGAQQEVQASTAAKTLQAVAKLRAANPSGRTSGKSRQ